MEQQKLLLSYENDFSRHAPSSLVPKLHHIWNSIPSPFTIGVKAPLQKWITSFPARTGSSR